MATCAVTYVLWFRAIARLGPSTATLLGFLSPLCAVLLGWGFLDEAMSPPQITWAALILGSVWMGRPGGPSC